MDKIGEYIRRIEIDSLWSGQKHIVWELNRKVNILSGVNGVGKSTILNKVILRLLQAVKEGCPAKPDVKLTYEPADAVTVRFDVVRSFDRPLVHSNLLEKLADDRVATELDWQLYLLQRRFLDYQVNVGNRMIALLTSGDPEAREKAKMAAQARVQFQDMVDELFSETGKKIVRSSNEIQLEQFGEVLSPYKLSSGEKQMLVILLTVLVEGRQPYVHGRTGNQSACGVATEADYADTSVESECPNHPDDAFAGHDHERMDGCRDGSDRHYTIIF